MKMIQMRQKKKKSFIISFWTIKIFKKKIMKIKFLCDSYKWFFVNTSCYTNMYKKPLRGYSGLEIWKKIDFFIFSKLDPLRMDLDDFSTF